MISKWLSKLEDLVERKLRTYEPAKNNYLYEDTIFISIPKGIKQDTKEFFHWWIYRYQRK